MMEQSLEEQFGLSLVVLARLYRRELDLALRQYGVSEATVLPIRYLAQLGDQTRQGQLAQMMRLEGPTLVRVIDQLQAGGLVERVPDEEDRRARLIRLTDKGRAFHDHVLDLLRQLRARLFEGMDPRDMQAALRCFQVLAHNLGQGPAEVPGLFEL